MKHSAVFLIFSIIFATNTGYSQSCKNLNDNVQAYENYIKKVKAGESSSSDIDVMTSLIQDKCQKAVEAFRLINPEGNKKDFKKHIDCSLKRSIAFTKKQKQQQFMNRVNDHSQTLTSLQDLVSKTECKPIKGANINFSGCVAQPRSGRCTSKKLFVLDNVEYCCEDAKTVATKESDIAYCDRKKQGRINLAKTYSTDPSTKNTSGPEGVK